MEFSKLPTISVVITAYNEEKYIERTMQHLRKQTLPNFELIVVDNNSTDRTAEIARQYGARVLTEKKQGYVFSLNHGMCEAKNEVIVVTDADSQPTPQWLEKVAEAFADTSVVAFTGSVEIENNSPIEVSIGKFFYDFFIWVNFLIGKPHLCGPNMAVRRDIFHKINGLNTEFQMSPDVDLGLRAKKYGKVVFREDAVVVTSPRRWERRRLQTAYEYAKSYWYVIWLRRPPPVRQVVVR